MATHRKPVATEMASAAFHHATPANQNIEEDQDACSILLLPFVLHLAFMAFTALFVMHVQVSNMIIFLVKAKACVGGSTVGLSTNLTCVRFHAGVHTVPIR